MCQGQAVLLRSCWKKIPKPAPGATSSLEGKPEGSCLVRRKPKEGVSSALCLVCQSGSALTPPPGPHSLPDVSVPVGFPANHRSVCPCVLLYIHPRCTPAVAAYASLPVKSSLSRERKARWLHPATNPNGKYFVTK